MHSGLQALVRDTDRLAGQDEAREKHRRQCADDVAALTAEDRLLGFTDAALTALLQQTSAANLKAIEELVTSGLHAVFDDLSLTFHFEVGTERNQQALTPVLASHGTVEGPILDSHGGGPAQVVALLLRILTVHRLGLHPLVVLDESLNMVSDQVHRQRGGLPQGLVPAARDDAAARDAQICFCDGGDSCLRDQLRSRRS